MLGPEASAAVKMMMEMAEKAAAADGKPLPPVGERLLFPQFAGMSAAQCNETVAPMLLAAGAHPCYVACYKVCDFHFDPKRVHTLPPHEQELRVAEWNAALEKYVPGAVQLFKLPA